MIVGIAADSLDDRRVDHRDEDVGVEDDEHYEAPRRSARMARSSVVASSMASSSVTVRAPRLTVSLPDELVERIKAAAGGEGRVSAYVAGALADYQERTSLDEVLAAWRQETPVSEEMRRQVSTELDDVGLTSLPGKGRRMAG